jgi:hypothetical protein
MKDIGMKSFYKHSSETSKKSKCVKKLKSRTTSGLDKEVKTIEDNEIEEERRWTRNFEKKF